MGNYIFYGIVMLGYMISFSKLFPKGGRKSWEGWIPFYHFVPLLKMANKPVWWVFLLIFPGVNVIMFMVFNYQCAVIFGKRNMVESTLAVLFPFLYLPYIAFQENTTFYGPVDRSKTKKSAVQEWFDAIVFAIVAASIIRTYFLEAFTIPTSSMEKTLLKGDYLFVSKINYGPKIPNTPLSFPFAHHTLPGTEGVKSFLEWMTLPYFRFPGFEDVERNDVVVFNFPEGDTVAIKQQNQSYYDLCRRFGRDAVVNNKTVIDPYTGRMENDYFGEISVRPIDKKENYIKRCVGIPGDTLEVINGELIINGKSAYVPPYFQFKYWVKTSSGFGKKIMKKKFDVNPDDLMYNPGSSEYLIPLTLENVDKISALQNVSSVQPNIAPFKRYIDDPMRIFPNDAQYQWSENNFGPVIIPKAGDVVTLNTKNLPIYRRLITSYEKNTLEVKNGEIWINGIKTNEYTFKMDCYWLMGDSRHNSQDSRFWGFVPEDHVVGKAVMIWMSLDPDLSWSEGKIRWDRFFNLVHK